MSATRVASPQRHRFHAICPYFAMFPETFVERWVEQLTEPGDLVADPFSGRGTTALQSLLAGRRALACDVNPVAYVLTRAKTNAPARARLHERLTALEAQHRTQADPAPGEPTTEALAPNAEFFRLAFAPATLDQLLFLRAVLDVRNSDVDCMIAALILGALHGESTSPRYLSNQMPRTISTKPAYSVRFWQARNLRPAKRDVFTVLRTAVDFRYASARPKRRATVLLGDMRELPRQVPAYKARLVITSPPYLDTTSFEEDQWLRLWFLGGAPRPTKGVISRDDRLHTRDAYWQLIGDLWRTLGHLVAAGGHIVIRIAGRGLTSDDLTEGLIGTSVLSGRSATLVSQETSPIARRQTDAFRPGSTGLRTEVDCHFQLT
jgi:hypothetical protein